MFAVKEDTLTDMVDAMKEDIGLVHQMPYTCDGAGLPSTLEKVKLNRRQCFLILSRPDIDLTIWLSVTNNLHLGLLSISILYTQTDTKDILDKNHQWELEGFIFETRNPVFHFWLIDTPVAILTGLDILQEKFPNLTQSSSVSKYLGSTENSIQYLFYL